MDVAWYITAHGRGHAARALRILRALPADARIHLRTAVPRGFFAARLNRRFEHGEVVVDTGPLHLSDGTVDFPTTIRRYEEILATADDAVAARERAFLAQREIDVVVCDIPPWPAALAQSVGIPSVLTVNFTWVEILAPAAAADPRARRLVERLRTDYSAATIALRTPPALPMDWLPRVREVPLIAAPGRECRVEIAAESDAPVDRRWAYLYFGEFGIDWIPDDTLPRFANWSFLTRHRPDRPIPGLHVLPPDGLAHEDLIASVDAVVAKPGYGIITECISNGTPLVTTGRDDFAEYAALETAMNDWGGAVVLPQDDLLAGRWDDALAWAADTKLEPSRADGAVECARAIVDLAAARS